MTPQEKAIELVNKFGTVGLQQREEGIECALIAVDEILNECLSLKADFWQQVKEEIEKL
jgi:hypothetical protein